ncbi:hypothetical protein M8494_03165 [Serratia ureilytica]
MAGFSDSTAKNISDALDINNTSRFSLQDVDFAFSYGGASATEYKKGLRFATMTIRWKACRWALPANKISPACTVGCRPTTASGRGISI